MAKTAKQTAADVVTLEVGQKVFNAETEQTGEVVQRESKDAPEIKFTNTENGKEYHVKITQLWMPVDTAPENVLDKVLDAPTSKTPADAPKSAPKPDTNGADKVEPVKPLTDEEIETRKKLVTEYKRQDANEQNAFLRKCEIIHEIRTAKLFRDNFKTFGEFAVKEFGVTREYSQNLAQIGEFYNVSKDYIKNNKLSVNSINQLIRQNNKLMADMGVETEQLSDFAPVIEKVLAHTIEASKNDKGKVSITPRIVDTVASEVSTAMSELKTKKTGADLIALAAKTLGANGDDILRKTRERLADTGKQDKNGANGAETGKTGESVGAYDGKLSGLDIVCTLHTEFVGNQIVSIGTGTLQMKCSCKFKMDGMNLVPYEIDGKRVKPAVEK